MFDICKLVCIFFSTINRENATFETSNRKTAYLDIHLVSSHLYENYFSDAAMQNLKFVYSLLYPNCEFPKKHIMFYNLDVLG